MKKTFLLLAAALVVFGASHLSFAADEEATEHSAAAEHASDNAVEHAADASVVKEGEEGDDTTVEADDTSATDEGSDVTTDDGTAEGDDTTAPEGESAD